MTAGTRSENLAQGWRAAIEQGVGADASASWASSDAVRNVMRANKSRDTDPELALRRAVHALGLRYRVNRRPDPSIRRTADLVFAGPKVAVFLDGCYWHGCPEHYRPASKNAEFWSQKIDGNRARDVETDRLLQAAGWTVVRVWEHEDPRVAADRIAEVVLRGAMPLPSPGV
ncbi:very short patch repair endonuclease [Catellatospora sp. NPDC049609]|uniref:very short patch repair endonuclease n=1 Tax=Catellatospora sp. NPDC049609 TaxID=3155505 RepID=UPI003442AB9A